MKAVSTHRRSVPRAGGQPAATARPTHAPLHPQRRPAPACSLAACVLATAVCWAAAASAHEGHATLPAKGASVDGQRVALTELAQRTLGLATARARLADLADTLDVVATVEVPWSGSASVGTLVTGRITQLAVHPGDQVSAAQRLATIESLEIETLARELLDARESLALAQRLFDQRETLVRDQAVALRELFGIRQDRQQAASRVAVALGKLLALNLPPESLEQLQTSGRFDGGLPILAPIAGRVGHTEVHTGQMVTPGEHLFDVLDTSRLWVVGQVLAADSARVQPGQSASFVVADGGSHCFEVALDAVGLKVDGPRQTLPVYCSVDNSAGHLQPGMSGHMRIDVQTVSAAVVVPPASLVRQGESTVLFVEDLPGTYLRTPVRVGLKQHDAVEVYGDVFPGDPVLVHGQHELAALFDQPSLPPPSDVVGDALRDDPRPEYPGGSAAAPPDELIVTGRVELCGGLKMYATNHLGGRLARILVEPGQAVAAGDVLAEIDSQPLKDMQLALLSARARQDVVAGALARVSDLAGSHAVAARQIWQLEADAARLALEIDNLQRQLALAGLSPEAVAAIVPSESIDPAAGTPPLPSVPVRAPAAGLIADCMVRPGQVVPADLPLVEIHAPQNVFVEAFVFQHDVARVRPGQPVRVSVAGRRDVAAQGVVFRLAASQAHGPQALAVWIDVANPRLLLKDGMLVRAAIDTSRVVSPPNVRPHRDHAVPPRL